jgi:hypothetical protein
MAALPAGQRYHPCCLAARRVLARKAQHELDEIGPDEIVGRGCRFRPAAPTGGRALADRAGLVMGEREEAFGERGEERATIAAVLIRPSSCQHRRRSRSRGVIGEEGYRSQAEIRSSSRPASRSP